MRTNKFLSLLLGCSLLTPGVKPIELNRDHLIGAGVALVSAAAAVPLCKYASRYFAKKQEPFVCSKVTGKSFDDFVGQEEVVLQAQSLVQIFNNQKACEEFCCPLPAGVIIEGARGNGKTLLARIIAAELGGSVLEIPSNFFNADSASAMRKRLRFLFNFAKKKSQEELIIIYIDGLSQHRQRCENFVTLLLEQIKGTKSNGNIFFIGEVRKFKDLGVSKKEVACVGLERLPVFYPNIKGRAEILKFCMRKIKLADHLLVDELAKEWAQKLIYRSTQDLMLFVKQAAFIALLREADSVTAEDFINAFLKLRFGEYGNKARGEDEVRRIAVHEAGHALAHALCGSVTKCLTVIPREGFDGVAIGIPRHENTAAYSRGEILRFVIGALGGFCAEKIIFGDVSAGCSRDLEKISRELFLMVTTYGMGEGDLEAAVVKDVLSEGTKKRFDNAIFDLRKKCLSITMKLFEERRDILVKLASVLQERELLQEDEICAIIGEPRDVVAGELDTDLSMCEED